jgi:outer membrane protein assembly factor BamD (BamD/ComL family)
MSIAGISSSTLFDSSALNIQSRIQRFQHNYQQLGQDLQSGNLSAAQSDCTALQQSGLQSSSTSQPQTSNPLAQDFSQLSQDLGTGNLSASQQDFAKLQQDLQGAAPRAHHHHHHENDAAANPISQLFTQLGQALQSGNLSNAQQAYSTLLQDFQQFGQGASQTPSTPSASPAFSINA